MPEQTVFLIFEHTSPTVRDTYPDDTQFYLENAPAELFADDAEALKEITAAKERNWEILPGMMCVRQVVAIDGVRHGFRGAEPLVKICKKYNLF